MSSLMSVATTRTSWMLAQFGHAVVAGRGLLGCVSPTKTTRRFWFALSRRTGRVGTGQRWQTLPKVADGADQRLIRDMLFSETTRPKCACSERRRAVAVAIVALRGHR